MIASAFIKNLRISTKNATIVAKFLKGKSVKKAKMILERAIKGIEPIDGKKYYTKTAKIMLKALNSAIANAINKKLDENRLRIKTIRVHKGPKIVTPKKAKFAGRTLKNTHLEIILGY
ncbi:MAG: uL22 family ribosomal protein [Candidatus Aenigmatarchaeota archaeon]